MPTVQHAVPYPMMMPPPSNVPHPYEGGPAPPVQMGGHAWASWQLCGQSAFFVFPLVIPCTYRWLTSCCWIWMGMQYDCDYTKGGIRTASNRRHWSHVRYTNKASPWQRITSSSFLASLQKQRSWSMNPRHFIALDGIIYGSRYYMCRLYFLRILKAPVSVYCVSRSFANTQWWNRQPAATIRGRCQTCPLHVLARLDIVLQVLSVNNINCDTHREYIQMSDLLEEWYQAETHPVRHLKARRGGRK